MRASHATLTTMSFANRRRRVLVFVAGCLLAAVVFGLSPFFRRTLPHVPTEPLFSGLGPHVRQATTHAPLCQKYFDQGLPFLFGFNQDEAIRSFEVASYSARCKKARQHADFKLTAPCLCLPGKD
jgi:hypothetical protein